ncbi:hypothetical protein D3C85_953630 [compost metagenome]
MIGEVAGVSLPRDGRWEGAKIDLAGKLGQGPGARHYHGGLAGGKGIHRLSLGGIGRMVAYVGPPARQLTKRRHIRGIGHSRLTVDQRQAAIFPMPVVGADILVAKLGDHPAVVGRQRQRQIAAILLHLLQHGEEVSTGSRRCQPKGVEDIDIEVETLDHGGNGQAEGLGPGVGLPGGLGKAREVLHPGQVRQIQQMPLLEQPQGLIIRTASDEIPRLSRRQPLGESLIIIGRTLRLQLKGYLGMERLKTGQKLLLPQRLVIHAPGFQHQLLGHRRRTQPPDQQGTH